MPSQPSNLTTLLAELAASGVEFVLVGGLAAVAQGAPITTFDVDIVHSRTPENIDRLLAFLGDVNARYRGRPGGEPLPPSRTALEGPGHSLFMPYVKAARATNRDRATMRHPTRPRSPHQLENDAYVVYAEWGPLACLPREKRLASEFPMTTEATREKWIRESSLLCHLLIEFPQQQARGRL